MRAARPGERPRGWARRRREPPARPGRDIAPASNSCSLSLSALSDIFNPLLNGELFIERRIEFDCCFESLVTQQPLHRRQLVGIVFEPDPTDEMAVEMRITLSRRSPSPRPRRGGGRHGRRATAGGPLSVAGHRSVGTGRLRRRRRRPFPWPITTAGHHHGPTPRPVTTARTLRQFPRSAPFVRTVGPSPSSSSVARRPGPTPVHPKV